MNRTASLLALLLFVFPSSAGAVGVESSALSLTGNEARHFSADEDMTEQLAPTFLWMQPSFSDERQRRKAAPLESNGATSNTWFVTPRLPGAVLESSPTSR